VTATAQDWLALRADADPETRANVIRATSEEFDAALARPGASDEIQRFVREQLRDSGITVDTYSPIDRFLTIYVGPTAGYMLAWTLVNVDERLPIIDAAASPAAAATLRTLVATNPSLEEAYRSWREIPNNWRRIARELFDVAGEGPRVRLRLTTYDQQAYVVETTPAALMSLTCYMLETLTMSVPFSEYEDVSVDEFFGTMSKVNDWVSPAGAEVDQATPIDPTSTN
jgi:hypothetical protein